MKKFLITLAVLFFNFSYASEPVKLIIPYAAGGAVDLVGRTLQNELSQALGKPVIIDYKIGAGGDLALEHVAKHQQGTMLTIAGPAMASNNILPNARYSLDKDLLPLFIIGNSPSFLVVNKNSHINKVSDISLLKNFTYGSSGVGSGGHLYGILLSQKIKTSGIHVPYRSQVLIINDVIAGNVDMAFCFVALCQSYIEAGTLKAIAFTGPARHKTISNVPTFSEIGLQSVKVRAWFMLVANSNANSEDLAKLQKFMPAILSDLEMQKSLQKLGIDVDKNEIRRASEVLKDDIQFYKMLFQNNPDLKN